MLDFVTAICMLPHIHCRLLLPVRRVWCTQLYRCPTAPFEYVKVLDCFDCADNHHINVAIVVGEQRRVVWDHHVTEELDM